MKASLKLREDQNPLLRAKIPVSVLGLPFISGISTGDSNELCLHLRTASSAGPSLKISYRPNDSYNPFSLAIKSGIGLWGSPQKASMIMAAEFRLLGQTNPSFTFQIKPEFGDFALKKTFRSFSPVKNAGKKAVVSEREDLRENGLNGVGFHQNGVVGGAPPEKLLAWKDWPDFQADPVGGFQELLSGFAVMAKTGIPVRKHAAVKIRWGVNLRADSQECRREFGRNMLPFLTVEKISIENVEEKKRASGDCFPAKSPENADLEYVKGMCLFMKREVEALQRENGLVKESLEALRLGNKASFVGNGGRENENGGKKNPENDGSGEFDKWKKKKNNGVERREVMTGGFPGNSGNPVVDVSGELEKAIKAASGI